MSTGKKEHTKEKDALFKHHFSHRAQVIDFLKAYLPEELTAQIDFDSLQELKREYLSQKFTRNVDILWEAKLKSGKALLLVFHFEAQGQHDKTMMGRSLVYHGMVGIEYLQKGEKIPTIITFVVYHGKGKWTSPRSVEDAFEDFGTHLTFALKRDLIIDLPRTPIEELKKSKKAFVVQALLSKESKGDMKSIVGEAIEEIKNEEPCCKKRDIDFLFSQNKGTDEEILEEFRKFAPELKQEYNAMFEKSNQKHREIGRQEGMKEGVKKGIQRGILQLIQNLKKLGVSQAIIAKAQEKMKEITL